MTQFRLCVESNLEVALVDQLSNQRPVFGNRGDANGVQLNLRL